MPHRGVVAAPARYRQGTERRESHSHSHSHSIQTGRGSSRHRAVLASPDGVREAQQQIQQQLRRVMAGSRGGHSSSSGHPGRVLPRCSRERARCRLPLPPRRPQCCHRTRRCSGLRRPRRHRPARPPPPPPASRAAPWRRRHRARGSGRLGCHLPGHSLRPGRRFQPPSHRDPARRGRPPRSSRPRRVSRPSTPSCRRSSRP